MSRESDDNLSSINSAYTDDYYLEATGRRRSSDHNSTVLTANTEQFIIGQRVWVGGLRSGQIAYIGETHFAPGDWAGIVLDEPNGKNDGCVSGKRYFQCEPKRGIFSRLTRLTTYPLSGAMTPTSPLSKQSPDRSLTVSPTASMRSSMLRSPGTGKNGLTVGDRVIVSSGFGSRPGILRYLGETQFAPGNWCGVELDEGSGKNDGAVDGIRYFECKPKFGVFVPIAKVSLSPSSKKTRLSRTGSRESLTSIGTMNSIATTNTSRIRMNAQRKSSTPIRSIVTTPKNQFSMQDLLREKQQHVEQLMVERDLDREDAQNQALHLQKNINELKLRILQLESQLGDERKKSEELQFSIDEAQFCGDEMNAQSQVYKEKIFDLEKKITKLVSATPSLQSIPPMEESVALANAKAQIAELQEKLSNQEKLSEARHTESLDEQERLLENINYLQKQNETLQLELMAKDESLEKFSLSECGIENLRRELALLKEENEKQAQQAKEAFDQQLAEKVEQVRQLSKELHEIKSSSYTLESQRAHVTDACEILQTEIRMRDEQIKELNQQLDEVHTQWNVQKADSSALDELLTVLQTQNADSKKLVEELQAANTAMAHEKQQLQQQLSGLQEQLRASGDSNALLQQQQLENAQLKEAKQALEQQLQQESKLVQTHKAETEEKDLKLQQLQHQLDEQTMLRAQLVESQQQLKLERAAEQSQASERTLDLEATLKAKQSQLEQLQQQLLEQTQIHAQQVENQEQLRQSHAAELSQTSARAADLEATLKATQTQLEQLQLEATRSGEHSAQQLMKLQAEFAQLQSKESETQAALSERLVELETAKQQQQTLQAALEKKKDELATAQMQCIQTETQLKASAEVEISDVKRQNAALLAKCESQQQQQEKVQSELIEARSSTTQLQETLKQLNVELQGKQQSLAALESVSSTQRLELASDNELLQQTNARLERELKEVQQNLEKMKLESEQRQTQLVDQEQLVIQKDLALGDAGRQREQLEARCQSLLQQQETLQQQLNNLHSSSTDSNAELLKLSQQLLEQQQTNEQLSTKSNEERGGLERQLQASQQRLDALCGQVELLTKELASSTEQSAELQGKLKAEQELAAKQTLELSDAQRKLEATTVKCEQLEQQQAKLQQELNSERTEGSELNSKLTQLTEQLSNAEKQLSLEKDASSEKRLQLERELQVSRASINESQTNEAAAREQLKTELEKRDQELKQLQVQLSETQAANEVAIKELQERLDITNTELKHKEQLAIEDAQKIADLKTLVEAIQVANANISTTNAELSTVLEVLQAEKSETAHIFELFEMETDMNAERLLEKLQGMKQELQDTHSQLETQLCNSKELEAKLQELQKHEENLQGTAIEAAEELRQRQQANGELQDALQQSQSKLAETQQQLEESQIQFKQLQEQLQQVQQSETQLQAEVAKSNEQLHQLQAISTEQQQVLLQKQQLLDKGNELDDQLSEYQKVIDEMDEASREKSSKMQQLEIRIKELELALHQAKESQQLTHLECQQLTRKLHSLELEEAREIMAMRAQANGSSNPATEGDDAEVDTETNLAKINFLNSIIADMQQKNDALKAKVQTLETLPIDFTKPYAFEMLNKRKPAPRLFCDICDEFDKHETEDCPLQAGDERDYSPPPPADSNSNEKERKLPAPRKYCESCEVFGHDTSECADDETY
ncbi:restin homolog isoform X9 [Drosophila hydei]|nr:restin homolog isoform X9 [Drosophila hydei]